MIHPDPLAPLKCLVQRKALVATLLEPMIALLAQAAAIHLDFQKADDQTLGHVDRDVKRALGGFMTKLLE